MRAEEGFYERRGGKEYRNIILRFKKEQYQNGYYSWRDYLISSTVHRVVCLMPPILRKQIYLKMLRHHKLPKK